MYFASMQAQAEKSQQVPPNWLSTVEFQLDPLTFRQSKLSANAPREIKATPIAAEHQRIDELRKIMKRPIGQAPLK